MASPTEAEIRTQLRNAVHIVDQFRLYCGVSSINYIAQEDTLVQSLETNYQAELSVGLAAFRNGLAAIRAQGVTAGLLRPIFREYARFIEREAADQSDDGIFNTIYDYFDRNSITVQRRAITYGSPTASSVNVGDGRILRLRMDSKGYAVENIHASDSWVARCVRDGRSGTNRHEELFRFVSEIAEPDRLLIDGSGESRNIAAVSARNSLKLLTNPSFSERSGTDAVPTAITGWAVSSAAGNFIIDRTNYYRDFVGDTSPAAIAFETDDTLTQNFRTRNVQFAAGRPIYCQIAWNAAVSSATGNLTLRLGTASSTVAVSGVAGWNILRITIGSSAASASNAWFDNFNRGVDTAIQIARSGGGAGDLLVDDVILTQWVPLDGSWYVVVGGRTVFRRDDRFAWQDSEVGAKIQRAIWEGFGRFLPHSASPTITDP